MVFGDNVRARRATPHHTPPPFHNPQHNTTKQDKTRHALSSQQDGMQTVPTPPPFYPTQPSPLFHNDTTLSQRHNTKPTML